MEEKRESPGKRKILITGSEGYLMGQLIKRLKEDRRIEKIIGVDIKKTSRHVDSLFHYEKISVVDPQFIERFNTEKIDTVIHAAWQFNPIHNQAREDEIDLVGSFNVLRLVALNPAIKNLVYLGSTTCYGAIPENKGLLKEEDWSAHAEKRQNAPYGYSRNKAKVDWWIQNFQKDYTDKNIFWIRGAIVLGRNTPNNIVAYVVKSPFTFGKYMFKVRGYDPHMQFLSEHDINQVLYRAAMNQWSGVVNLAGDGIVKYSDVIELLGRKQIELPASVLYPACQLLWKMRLLKFPASLIDLIRYPWVGSIRLLKEKYNYRPLYSSLDALLQYKETLDKK